MNHWVPEWTTHLHTMDLFCLTVLFQKKTQITVFNSFFWTFQRVWRCTPLKSKHKDNLRDKGSLFQWSIAPSGLKLQTITNTLCTHTILCANNSSHGMRLVQSVCFIGMPSVFLTFWPTTNQQTLIFRRTLTACIEHFSTVSIFKAFLMRNGRKCFKVADILWWLNWKLFSHPMATQQN